MQIAVRLANCLYDIRPLVVDIDLDLASLEQKVRLAFADAYCDLDQYRMYLYTDAELVTGVFNVLITGPSDLYSGALVTVVTRPLEPVPLPRANYDDRVTHMVQARSRVLEWMSSRTQYDADALFREGMVASSKVRPS